MTMDEKNVKLKKMNLPQLYDLKERQLVILKNKIILKNLADKGEQVKVFLEKIECEIKEREATNQLEIGMKSLDLNNDSVSSAACLKYVQHMCSIEKVTIEDRFKPFRTYLRGKETLTVKESADEISRCIIPLKESVELQSKQAVRVQEDHSKSRYREKVNESDTESEDSTETESDDDDDNDGDNKNEGGIS